MHRNEFINMIDNLLLYGGRMCTAYDDILDSIISSGIRGSGGEPVLTVEDRYEDIEMELWQKRNRQRLSHLSYQRRFKDDKVNEG